jgi:hypothetical protein
LKRLGALELTALPVVLAEKQGLCKVEVKTSEVSLPVSQSMTSLEVRLTVVESRKRKLRKSGSGRTLLRPWAENDVD